MRIVHPWWVVGLAVALTPAVLSAQTSQSITSAWETPQDREFDFWVGEWDVLLRIRQDDTSWKDSRHAKAKIYRILDGKAILELWDEQVEGAGIRGFSLRHFDHDAGHWVLYLDWPGRNRSTISSLTGRFRHGRGEFFSSFVNDDGDTVISRYTFADVSPTRLRWDDAYSRDGGRTWSHGWIMEFTRAADTASWPAAGEPAHTYHTGARCDREEFRAFERLAGPWHGELEVRGGDIVPARLTSYKVLDGCAVISFLEYDLAGQARKEFSFKTYNTAADAYQDIRLDNQRGTPLRSYLGSQEGDAIVLTARAPDVAPRRYRWTFPSAGRAQVVVRGPDDVLLLTGTFTREAP